MPPSLPVASAFVNPHLLLDTQDAAKKIVSALPELKYDEVKEKLDADKSFVWIKRGLSPREHFLVNHLGIPGLEFQADPTSPSHKAELGGGKRLVLYCGSGSRSALAAKTLKEMGIGTVAHVAGGFGALQQAGAPIEEDR